MNAIVKFEQIKTMSSREVAELCEKRHDNVMNDIRKMLSELGLHAPDFSGTYQTDKGNTYQCFNLPKRECLILVSGYKLSLRSKIIDRWQELEAKQADPIALLSDPNVLRSTLLNYSERVIELEQKVEVMQPDVEALERLSKADGSLCLTDAAKNLQVRRKDLIQWLQANGWIYKRQGTSWLAYSDKEKQGVLEHKTTTVLRPDGSEKITHQVRVTAKGLTNLSKKLPFIGNPCSGCRDLI